MVIIPFTWPVYLAGVMIAISVSSRIRAQIEARGKLLLVMVRFTAISVAACALFAAIREGVTIETAIAVKAGTVIALLVPWRATERAIAATCVFVALGAIAWTAIIALDPKAVWGAHVGVVGAVALFVGSVWWWVELFVSDHKTVCW